MCGSTPSRHIYSGVNRKSNFVNKGFFQEKKRGDFFFVWKKLVHSKTGLLGHSVYPTENVSKDWLGSLGFSLTPIDSNFYIPSGSRKKPSLIMDEIKFVFSKKATKIDPIFTVDLTFTKEVSNRRWRFINFCGLLRKHEP